MIIDNIAELPQNQRLMGLDVGERTIGVAISDIMQTIATPKETIKRKKFTDDARYLFELVDKYSICGLVIGLPLNMDGTEGKSCQSIRQFGRNICKMQNLPVYFQDERMTSQEAHRVLNQADMGWRRKEEVIDKMAASLILQAVLDRVKK